MGPAVLLVVTALVVAPPARRSRAKRAPDPAARARAECERVRAGSPTVLAQAIGKLPGSRSAWGNGLDPTQRCLLEVVAERADEAPDPAAQALAVVALSGAEEEKEIARAGLARITATVQPEAMRSALTSSAAAQRTEGYRIALALRVPEREPEVLASCIADPVTVGVCADAVLASPAGARLLARVLARGTMGEEVGGLAERRQAERRDLWTAMVDVARDRTVPDAERRRALALLAERGDPELAVDVAPIVLDEGDPVRADARRALALLQRRRLQRLQRGVRSRSLRNRGSGLVRCVRCNV